MSANNTSKYVEVMEKGKTKTICNEKKVVKFNTFNLKFKELFFKKYKFI